MNPKSKLISLMLNLSSSTNDLLQISSDDTRPLLRLIDLFNIHKSLIKETEREFFQSMKIEQDEEEKSETKESVFKSLNEADEAFYRDDYALDILVAKKFGEEKEDMEIRRDNVKTCS